MLAALARLHASIPIKISIKFEFTGLFVLCTKYTCFPRTDSSNSTKISPSAKCFTSHFPNSNPNSLQISFAKPTLDDKANTIVFFMIYPFSYPIRLFYNFIVTYIRHRSHNSSFTYARIDDFT